MVDREVRLWWQQTRRDKIYQWGMHTYMTGEAPCILEKVVANRERVDNTIHFETSIRQLLGRWNLPEESA
ncbi:hypothetical protein P692DRAFT_20828842 [Suillus brevipes Sb2]|nr:hypothetical protein P692DRAFT_20828842 [Suillus brevipes Sb2]